MTKYNTTAKTFRIFQKFHLLYYTSQKRSIIERVKFLEYSKLYGVFPCKINFIQNLLLEKKRKNKKQTDAESSIKT